MAKPKAKAFRCEICRRTKKENGWKPFHYARDPDAPTGVMVLSNLVEVCQKCVDAAHEASRVEVAVGAPVPPNTDIIEEDGRFFLNEGDYARDRTLTEMVRLARERRAQEAVGGNTR